MAVSAFSFTYLLEMYKISFDSAGLLLGAWMKTSVRLPSVSVRYCYACSACSSAPYSTARARCVAVGGYGGATFCLLYNKNKLVVGVLILWMVFEAVAALLFFIASIFASRLDRGNYDVKDDKRKEKAT
ncbi:hypothetical protein DPMN_096989 [Dreissena polymorpha]|uniref:Uncharacterized protein n=1 Tax=Dreissena polymorpha TaxID=45954 RepID=A0A9D4R5A1_DREPO|nr:hypothetical protein DPMN_096989 [Dreissena polymorpha]